MKKIILTLFFILGMVSFSRYINECKITSVTTKTMNCRSLESGKVFSFRIIVSQASGLSVNGVYKVYFSGNGNTNLILDDYDYLY